MALNGPNSYKATILTRDGKRICGAECRISVDDNVEAFSEVGVLIPDDSHSFREHVINDPHLILQLTQHPPYKIIIDAVHGLNGGLFNFVSEPEGGIDTNKC